MMDQAQLDETKQDLIGLLRGQVERTIDQMVRGPVASEKTRNPFSGEEMKLRARPVYPPLVELRKRLAGEQGALSEADRTLLRRVLAYVATETVGRLAASTAGEGELIGDIDLAVTDPDGEPLLEGVYSLIPTPDEVAIA